MVPSVVLMAKRDALLAGMVLAVAPNKTPLATVSWPCMQEKKIFSASHDASGHVTDCAKLSKVCSQLARVR